MSTQILLIEDNTQNSYLTCFLLRHCGYEVAVSPSGLEGLDIAARIRPDLILLDIQLPGMDGYEVARRLKADPRLRSIPIVAVTSYALQGDREKCIEAGAEGYIEKPIDPDCFVEQVERFLPPRLRSRSASSAP